MTAAATSSDLRSTPLLALHQKLGARMVPFAGYSMPVQYPQGLMAEHLHTRKAAGLFDVSHMGQLLFLLHYLIYPACMGILLRAGHR